MAICDVNTIDSNITGLRFAEEDCLGQLGVNPVWYPLEPNSYTDWGAEITTVARNPINPSRQRKKGTVVDLDAAGGLNQDLTQMNVQRLMQAYMFADFRTKGFSQLSFPLASTAITVANGGVATKANHGLYTGYGPVQLTGGSLPTGLSASTDYWVIALTESTFKLATSKANALAGTGVSTSSSGSGDMASVFGATADGVVVGDATGFVTGQLVHIAGFSTASNNGVKTLTDVTGTALDFTGATAEDPNPNVIIASVGMATSDLTVDASGSLPIIETAGAVDFTDLGLTPGEWIYVGGDGSTAQFTDPENNGFKRIRSISATQLVLDKSDAEMVTDASNTNPVVLYWGRFLKNEKGSLIKRRSLQTERTLGSLDGMDPPQSEYLVGAVTSEAVVNLALADKITVDYSFIALDSETRTQAEGLKAGSRPDLVEADAYNTTSDLKRVRMALAGSTDEAPDPLFAFVTELTLTLNNTLSANKALGKLGAIGVTAGTFAVSATTTAYFSSVEAIRAVRNNADVTFDVILVKDNAGIVADLPLVSLGDGRANVEIDQPITLPLTIDAAGGGKISPDLDFTLGWTFFDYLPDAASAD